MLKVNNFEFYLKPIPDSRGEWHERGDNGYRIHYDDGYWYMKNSKDEVFAFSKRRRS